MLYVAAYGSLSTLSTTTTSIALVLMGGGLHQLSFLCTITIYCPVHIQNGRWVICQLQEKGILIVAICLMFILCSNTTTCPLQDYLSKYVIHMDFHNLLFGSYENGRWTSTDLQSILIVAICLMLHVHITNTTLPPPPCKITYQSMLLIWTFTIYCSDHISHSPCIIILVYLLIEKWEGWRKHTTYYCNTTAVWSIMIIEKGRTIQTTDIIEEGQAPVLGAAYHHYYALRLTHVQQIKMN